MSESAQNLYAYLWPPAPLTEASCTGTGIGPNNAPKNDNVMKPFVWWPLPAR